MSNTPKESPSNQVDPSASVQPSQSKPPDQLQPANPSPPKIQFGPEDMGISQCSKGKDGSGTTTDL